jgi:hypothetical protein
MLGCTVFGPRRRTQNKSDRYVRCTFLRDNMQYNSVKADSHVACRAHAVPLPCREAKGLECVFPI